MKRIGPNTELWGTLVENRVGDDLQSEHKTVNVLPTDMKKTKRGHCSGDQTTKISVAAE